MAQTNFFSVFPYYFFLLQLLQTFRKNPHENIGNILSDTLFNHFAYIFSSLIFFRNINSSSAWHDKHRRVESNIRVLSFYSLELLKTVSNVGFHAIRFTFCRIKNVELWVNLSQTLLVHVSCIIIIFSWKHNCTYSY